MDKLDTEIHTRPTPLRGAADAMRCARKAATVPNLWLRSWIQHGVASCVKSFEIDLQIDSKSDPETIKIQAPGAVLEPSGDSLGRLGVSGGAS